MKKKKEFTPTEVFKKLFTLGIGTALLGEESLRNAFSDIKLPKEFLQSFMQSASRLQKTWLENFSKELIREWSQKKTLKNILSFLSENYEFHFQIQCSLQKKKIGGRKKEKKEKKQIHKL